jgi:hypothetical protein
MASRRFSIRYHSSVSTLVPSGRHQEHDVDALRQQAGDLERLLGERSDEVRRIKAHLDAFRITYRQQVGLLHEELDRLELELAEAELGILKERLGDSADTEPALPAGERLEAPPRFTTDAIRKLFRDVAKVIHPDLARDADARDRRHSLMIEANRAYALGDGEQLRAILQAWERSPEAVQGTDREAMRLRLARRIAQIEEQLEAFAADLAALKDSSLWKLKAMVDDEAAKGKDLVADMVRRLNRDILVATNRLDALRG